jgi:hypothetical protein
VGKILAAELGWTVESKEQAVKEYTGKISGYLAELALK